MAGTKKETQDCTEGKSGGGRGGGERKEPSAGVILDMTFKERRLLRSFCLSLLLPSTSTSTHPLLSPIYLFVWNTGESSGYLCVLLCCAGRGPKYLNVSRYLREPVSWAALWYIIVGGGSLRVKYRAIYRFQFMDVV